MHPVKIFDQGLHRQVKGESHLTKLQVSRVRAIHTEFPLHSTETCMHMVQFWVVSCIPATQVAEAHGAGLPWDGLH